MKNMDELREMLCEELEKITKKGELSAGMLDVIDKLTHSIKSIDTIMAMDEAGYSNEAGSSYARGRGRNARRDSMGRYSSRGRSYEGRSYDDYSYDEEKMQLKEKLHEAMQYADEGEKAMIKKIVERVDRI